MSIASTSQPLSTAENDQQSKGVVAPSSPSSQALSVLPVTLDASVSVSASPVSNSSPSSLLEQTSSLYPPPDAIVSETATETADYAVPSTETESLDHRTSSTLSTLEAEVGTNGNNYQVRPAISYAGLIIQVLIESTKIKLTLSEIYSAIMNNHPYYRHAPNGWQNSVRNSLSLNKAFLKVDRTPEEPGHGCFWALRPDIRESNEQALHRK
ncbi:fork head domain-domain-containing protein, partial [Lobosporangium transversale]